MPFAHASIPRPRTRPPVLRDPAAEESSQRPAAGHGLSAHRDHVALLGAQARRARSDDVRSGESRYAQQRDHRRDAAAEAGSHRHELSVDDELSLRQDPGAAAARGRCHRQARVWRCLRDVERAARQGPVPGSRLRLSRRRRTAHRRAPRAPEGSRHGHGHHLAGEGRHAPQQSEPRAAARSRSVALSRPRKPGARFCRVDAARRSGRPLARSIHDDADLARLSVAVRVLRHPDFQRRQVARPDAGACPRRVRAAEERRLRLGLFRRRPLPAPAQTHRSHLRRPHRREESHQVRARGASRFGGAAPVSEAREVGLPNGHVRHRERQSEDSRSA